MPFEKGHNHGGNGGRKKGTKNKIHLIRYIPKKWDTSFRGNAYDMEEVDWRLQNNLPLDDLIDTMNSKWDPAKRKQKKEKKNNDKDV